MENHWEIGQTLDWTVKSNKLLKFFAFEIILSNDSLSCTLIKTAKIRILVTFISSFVLKYIARLVNLLHYLKSF